MTFWRTLVKILHNYSLDSEIKYASHIIFELFRVMKYICCSHISIIFIYIYDNFYLTLDYFYNRK